MQLILALPHDVGVSCSHDVLSLLIWKLDVHAVTLQIPLSQYVEVALLIVVVQFLQAFPLIPQVNVDELPSTHLPLLTQYPVVQPVATQLLLLQFAPDAHPVCAEQTYPQ